MCGIAGITDGKQMALVRGMMDTLRHRGPDGSGLWSDDHYARGHTRLSIIDLEGGAQPMADAEGRQHIVFNGEIYNYVVLRHRIGEKSFRTRKRHRSDSSTCPLRCRAGAMGAATGRHVCLRHRPRG